MQTTTNKGRLAFAVGCFHFGVKKQPPYRLTPAQYVALVKQALERITTVNNVAADSIGDDEMTIQVDESAPSLAESGTFLPSTHFFSLTFDLYIPHRLQQELMGGFAPSVGRGEHFRVFLKHAYQCPVCFVQPLDPNDDADPSSCIAVIREYLRKSMNRDGADIWFEALGPSPFHADFFLQPVPAGTEAHDSSPFTLDISHPRGYAQVIVHYDPGDFADIEHAFTEFRDTVDNELDMFYEIKRTDVEAYRAWDDVEDLLRALTDTPDRRWLDKLKHYFSHSTEIGRLHRVLVDFEVAHLLTTQALERSLRSTYTGRASSLLRTFVDGAMSDRQRFPVDQLARLVTFMEERRSKTTELVIVLAAAVIGGIAGSATTILAQ